MAASIPTSWKPEELLNALPEAVLAVSPEGEIIWVNPAAERLWRRPFQDLAGQSIFDLLTGSGIAVTKDLNALVAEFGADPWKTLKHTAFALRGEGAQIPVHLQFGGQSAPDKALTLLIQDLSALHRLEQEKEAARREEDEIRRGVMRYVSKEVLDQLVHNPKSDPMEGKREYLTFLFADLRNFTRFTEKMGAEIISAALNDFLETLLASVEKYGGHVNKFVGDAILALFGSPRYLEDHEFIAVQCALDMVREVAALSKVWQKEIGLNCELSVGVNSGEVYIGNIGTQWRTDFTVIGDAVNIASRLENLTRVYGVDLLVGDATWRKVAGRVEGRFVDLARVKGKEDGQAIYEVIAMKPPQP